MTAIKYMHHVPGRLRLKGHHFHCHGDQARKAVAMLQMMPGVVLVRLNPQAASLTVHYDPAVQDQAGLLAAIEAAGCLHAGIGVHHAAAARTSVAAEGMGGVFAKALVGAIAQRTALRVIGVLL